MERMELDKEKHAASQEEGAACNVGGAAGPHSVEFSGCQPASTTWKLPGHTVLPRRFQAADVMGVLSPAVGGAKRQAIILKGV